MFEDKSGIARTMKWATRVRVLLEAAQGMLQYYITGRLTKSNDMYSFSGSFIGDIASQRPTMATVLTQLHEGLELEEGHWDLGDMENVTRDVHAWTISKTKIKPFIPHCRA
uniref:Uncharacterized protein n=1 Tax=Oryza brachyantha TaxID=4533 RepID=J3MWS3_ORYBR